MMMTMTMVTYVSHCYQSGSVPGRDMEEKASNVTLSLWQLVHVTWDRSCPYILSTYIHAYIHTYIHRYIHTQAYIHKHTHTYTQEHINSCKP